MTTDLDELRRRLDAVLHLHSPNHLFEVCAHCDETYPCATAQAAGVTDDDRLRTQSSNEPADLATDLHNLAVMNRRLKAGQQLRTTAYQAAFNAPELARLSRHRRTEVAQEAVTALAASLSSGRGDPTALVVGFVVSRTGAPTSVAEAAVNAAADVFAKGQL